LAIVHAPALGLTYTATENGPALCNRKPISTAKCGVRAIVLIDNYPEPRGVARELIDCAGKIQYVECGSIGLKICRVADSVADLFVKDVKVQDWDLAPGHLILKRAGGLLSLLDGASVPYGGGFERAGLIAAANQEVFYQTTGWLKSGKTNWPSVLPIG